VLESIEPGHVSYSEREREREDCIRSLRIFDLRCNHFINLNIFYFLLRERARASLPPCKRLKLVFVKKSVKVSQIYTKKSIKIFKKTTYFSAPYLKI
jgi:hypothetical protein